MAAKKNSFRGPRGGVTTRTAAGLVRKSFFLAPAEDGALRLAAFTERRSEASIIRELVRRHFGLDSTPKEDPPGA